MIAEYELRYEAAHWLDDYKGISEGSAKHRYLVDLFNDSGLCPRYKMTIYDAWCAMAVSDVFITLGITEWFPCVECSCAAMITLADAAGIWVENDAYIPSIGDIVLYDWDDSGKGDNTGVPDHVGIVQSVTGYTAFKVIEGNKNNTVGTRTMSVNGRYIRGFITPDYATAAASIPTPPLDVDGEIGPLTVKRLQRFCALEEDGFIDGQDPGEKKYWEAVTSDACGWTGGYSPTARAWQKFLRDHGYSIGDDFVDGELGRLTACATQNFLHDKGYYTGAVDCIVGSKTAQGLQTWLNSFNWD